MFFYEENILCGDMVVRSEILTQGFPMDEINLEKKYTQKQKSYGYETQSSAGAIMWKVLLWAVSYELLRGRSSLFGLPVGKSLPHCPLLLVLLRAQ